jgi:hypothetical protein
MQMILFRILILTFVLSPTIVVFGQIGGQFGFAFLDQAYSARSVGLGTNFLTAIDEDLTLGLAVPSLLNERHHKNATFNHSILSGGTNYGMFGYGHKLKKAGMLSGHIRYLSYGKMDWNLPTGETVGTFSAGDVIIGAGYGHQLNPVITVGANVNMILSTLESYTAFGMSADLSGTFWFEKPKITLTAMVRNFGYQFAGYTSNNRAPIGPNPMLAISHRLKHAPFRISILAHHLHKWDLSYNDPNAQPKKDPLTGELIEPERAGFMEKLGRHFTYQLELLLGKYVHIRAAFDYHQRQEMKVVDRTGMAGFSFGFGLMLKKFQLQYGINVISSAGFNNMMTFSTNLSAWKKRE